MLSLLSFEDAVTPSISSVGFLNLVEPEHRKQFHQLLMKACTSGEAFELECAVFTLTGERKNIHVKTRVIFDQLQMITHVLGVVRDLSKDVSNQNLIELSRSNQELEQFAYVASHDLQEPLRKIMMFTERLKSKLGAAVNGDAESFMKRIESSASNMRILIDNLLELSRANRSAHAYSPVHLHTLAQEVLGDLELRIEETKSSIVIPQTLPVIEGVPSELKQLFTNLLSNALKFTKPNVPANVTLVCTKLDATEALCLNLPTEKSYFKVDFFDNGIGFDQQQADRIFQAFQRLHGRSEYPGSGIGLAICKKIAENHHGIIFAESVPGDGSTFTVILPEKQL